MKHIKTLLITIVFGSLFMSQVYADDFGSGAVVEDREYSLEEMLKYTLEDETLALKEYEYILEFFDVTRPLTNIIKAEARHVSAIIQLYNTYNMEIPSVEVTSHLVLPETISDIYAIGIEAEIKNIAMYNQFLSQDLDPVLERTFTHLRDASISHLKAFERNADTKTTTASPRRYRRNM